MNFDGFVLGLLGIEVGLVWKMRIFYPSRVDPTVVIIVLAHLALLGIGIRLIWIDIAAQNTTTPV